MSNPFTISNRHNLDILGNTHIPDIDPIACAILIHGFKGYKDYGFIPLMAHDLCQQRILVHRINLSTSGMTNEVDTFSRPDLFELDTWMRQVEDITQTCAAIREGAIPGKSLPLFLIGHSRGGASVLLAAGLNREKLSLSGVITINAVDRCCRMEETEQNEMLERGYTFTESARTGQTLRINSQWLQEQLDYPEDHDVLEQAARAHVPACIIHGDADDAVNISAGKAIVRKLNTHLHVLEGGNHVLNMKNPSSINAPRSEPFLKAVDGITRFICQQSVSDAV